MSTTAGLRYAPYVLIAVAAFLISSHALYEVARTVGTSLPVAIGLPVCLDALAVAAGHEVARRHHQHRNLTYPLAIMLAAGAISLAANVLHADPTLADPLVARRILAGTPPAALLLGGHLLLVEWLHDHRTPNRRRTTKPRTRRPATVSSDPARSTPPKTRSETPTSPNGDGPRNLTLDEVLAQHDLASLERLAAEHGSIAAAARAVPCNRQTLYRVRQRLQEIP